MSSEALPPCRETITPLQALSLFLGIVALWSLTHRYLGLVLDGEIYAVQALSRLHTHLAGDIYLANTSQDRYTVFSPLYALAIRWLGLQAGSTTIFVFCRACYFAGAWFFIKRLIGPRGAWLSLAILICTVAPYGAFDIFESASDYLSARTLAEALVACAIAFWPTRRLIAALLMALAMATHPIMSLPGVLFIVCLSLSCRLAVALFAVGIVGIALFAGIATTAHFSGAFSVMDPNWLEVVRERSQFLFLNYWRLSDWELQLRPFLCLFLTWLVLDNKNARSACVAAAAVGAGGLLVAAVAGSIGPVALFVQGQAWRWMWITSLVAVLMLAPTAMSLWRSGRCGYLSAALLLGAWTFPPVNGIMLAAAALALWLVNDSLPPQRDTLLKQSAYVLILVMGAWTVVALAYPELIDKRRASLAVRAAEWLRSAFSLQLFALSMFALLTAYTLRGSAVRPWAGVCLSAILICISMPGSVESADGFQKVQEQGSVAEWRDMIPKTSTVLLLPVRRTAAFQWFTLDRPSYLTLSQSAGVVFSPVTAAEVRRRSEVLRPIADPDWMVLKRIIATQRKEKLPEQTRPLTADSLKQICADPVLGFVVAQESVGFQPVKNTAAGRWNGWYLYDCQRVQAVGSKP